MKSSELLAGKPIKYTSQFKHVPINGIVNVGDYWYRKVSSGTVVRLCLFSIYPFARQTVVIDEVIENVNIFSLVDVYFSVHPKLFNLIRTIKMDNDKRIRCNNCFTILDEESIEIENLEEVCPQCGSNALMDNFHRPSVMVPKSGSWVLTDIDSMQFVLKVSDYVVEVKEPIGSMFEEVKALYALNSVLLHDNESFWNSDNYDFSDIPVSYLDNYVSGFYKNAAEVYKLYGDDALCIFAECAFENGM